MSRSPRTRSRHTQALLGAHVGTPGLARLLGLRLAFALGFALAFALALSRAEVALADGPGAGQLALARDDIERVEERIAAANGREVRLTPTDERAEQRLRTLLAEHPEHPLLRALRERWSAARAAARGVRIEVTDAMLAYRQRKVEHLRWMSEQTARAWSAYQEELSRGGAQTRCFPAPAPDASDVVGRTVVLAGVRWPRDQFTQLDQSWLYAGGRGRGYYYLRADGDAFRRLIEALRRYQVLVEPRLPTGWTVIGDVVRAQLLVPYALPRGAKGYPAGTKAEVGWVVAPRALYVPNRALVRLDARHAEGASFAGEAALEARLAEGYSASEVPADVTPRQLIALMVTAVKEQNFRLFARCLPPDRLRGPGALATTRERFRQFRERFLRSYVHVEVREVQELPPFRTYERVGDAWKARDQARRWMVLRLFDDLGRVVGGERRLTVSQLPDGRWYVTGGGWPF